MEIEGTKFKIEERIFTIRGKQVMLDRDLAQLYGLKPNNLTELSKEISRDSRHILCSKLKKQSV